MHFKQFWKNKLILKNTKKKRFTILDEKEISKERMKGRMDGKKRNGELKKKEKQRKKKGSKQERW